MTKNYFYNTVIHPNGELTLHFKHTVPSTTRMRLAKRIQKKGKRKVSLYPDGRLEIFGNPEPNKSIRIREL